ncbi:MAG: sugar phosphate isomerase/epimerase [Actinobacteria bacterium]|nr:sugar phosphate isomerase/epimerase [Actinomycetota bacterium]
MPLSHLILWAGTLGPYDFAVRLDCAARAGYQAMSVAPWDCRMPEKTKSQAARLRRRAEDRGVALSVLDPFTTWLAPADAGPGGAGSEQARYARLFASYQPTEIFTMAAELGAATVTAVAPVVGRPSEAADRFAAACAEAAGYGLRLQLEFMPFTPIPNLQRAWQVVSQAGPANGGLVLDVWHFRRSGSSLTQLAAIPADRLFTVQLSDGPADPEPDLWHAASHGRRLPGTGQLDVTGILRSLRAMGARPEFGPEVVSDSLSALGALEASVQAAAASRRVLSEAGF